MPPPFAITPSTNGRNRPRDRYVKVKNRQILNDKCDGNAIAFLLTLQSLPVRCNPIKPKVKDQKDSLIYLNLNTQIKIR